MPESVTFNNDWYARLINAVMARHTSSMMADAIPSTDAMLMAEAVMTAGAFIAEALQMQDIDTEGDLTMRLHDIALAAERLADKFAPED